MSISKLRERIGSTGLRYLFATLFCILLSTVYESFSHGVYSNWMIFLFAYPLLLGVVPFGAFRAEKRFRLGDGALTLWGCGVAALSGGSLITGIMDIYGTKPVFAPIYWTAGAILLAAAAVAAILERHPEKT